MQVCEIRTPNVHRGMDLIRDLLLRFEDDPKLNGTQWVHYSPGDLGMEEHSPVEIGYHVGLLIEEGLVRGALSTEQEDIPAVSKLTWRGHELASDIRDDTIWVNTKKRAKGLAGVGIALIWEIAKAEIKTKLGLPLP